MDRNIYTNSLRAYTISSAYFAIFSKVEKVPPFFFYMFNDDVMTHIWC